MADVDYFLKISGIQGESQDRTHRDEIEVRSWSWGLAKPAATGPGGAGRAAFQDFSIIKSVDKASPKLAEACVTGKHFPEAVLTARRAGGPNFSLDFILIKLSDVIIPRYQGSADESESTPIDSFSIDFTKIEYSYSTQKADGTPDAAARWTWDLKANSELARQSVGLSW